MMKKLLFLLLISAFLFGCASLKESEFWEHDSMFKSGAHMSYSLWGHKNPTPETQKKSDEEAWWGAEVPYIPAK